MSTAPMYRVTQVVTGVAGAPYYLTGYFAQSGGTAQQAADAWRAFTNPGTTTLRSGMVYQAMSDVQVVGPESGEVLSIEPVSVVAAAFTNATDPIPPSSQLLIRFRTGVFILGREIRGRISLPGYTEAESTGGQPSGALVTSYQTKVTTLIADVNSTLVVWSRKNLSQEPVISGSPWGQWAVLRSRRD